MEGAYNICKEKNLSGHTEQVELEREKLLEVIKEMKRVVEDSSICEMVDKVAILNYNYIELIQNRR